MPDRTTEQSGALALFETQFEGAKITTLAYKGRPCWLAGQVGAALGYQDPKRFATKFAGEWADEALRGIDFDIVRGSDLADLREVDTETVSTFASSALVIYESGLHLALLRTRKPVGQRLRRFLAEYVLPQIARDGQYQPERQVTPQGDLVESTVGSDAARRNELDLVDRELAQFALALDLQVRNLDLVERERRLFPEKRPTSSSSTSVPAGWESAGDIAERAGVSRYRVGKIARDLGLKNRASMEQGLSCIVRTANGGPWYHYSPDAVRAIEERLQAFDPDARN